MARPLVSDELWALIEPQIPKVPRSVRCPGRKRLDDRKVLTGILCVLLTGVPWEYLPQEMGCGSGMTCWRRLHEWQEAGVWQRLHELLLAKLHGAELISGTLGRDAAGRAVATDRIREGACGATAPRSRGARPRHASGMSLSRLISW
jgi:transposase